MRDYIIINGVNSLSIKGLAITKLPSIYKPIMRTEIEEIDGRNGDIITELGYGAYNKELTIGLFGDYDIDEIIAFFNQKGTIIFSNENDKVYNFDIVDQIEFEKLIKFRSATINIHCQPFKYPLSETPIEVEYEYVTGEGENITLNDTDISALELDLKGNTSQSGTPTPTNPIPVNVVSGDNEINVIGKNLLSFANYTNISGTSSLGVTRTFDGETIILNGTTTSAGNIVAKSSTGIILKAGTYTGSITTSGSYNRPSGDVAFYLRKNNTASGMFGLSLANMTTDGQYSSSFILTEDTEIFLEIYTNASNITFNNYICKFQIENGFSATDFVQYQGNTYNIDLGVENKFNKDQWYNQRSFLFSNNRATMSEDGTITSILPSAMDFAINLIPPMSATATQTQIDQVNAAGFDISNLENITISFKNANSCKGQILALFYKADYGYISVVQQDFTESNVASTFDVPSNAKYLCLRFDNESYNTTPTILKIEDIQIEAGTKANTYTPYGTTPIELCKIGNYQDYFYKDSDKWYLHKEIGKVVLNGSETISSYDATSLSGSYQATFEITTKSTSTEKIVLSNYFASALLSDRTTKTNICYTYSDGLLRIATNLATTMADFKAWLSTHNVVVYYVLATPVNTALEDM